MLEHCTKTFEASLYHCKTRMYLSEIKLDMKFVLLGLVYYITMKEDLTEPD